MHYPLKPFRSAFDNGYTFANHFNALNFTPEAIRLKAPTYNPYKSEKAITAFLQGMEAYLATIETHHYMFDVRSADGACWDIFKFLNRTCEQHKEDLRLMIADITEGNNPDAQIHIFVSVDGTFDDDMTCINIVDVPSPSIEPEEEPSIPYEVENASSFPSCLCQESNAWDCSERSIGFVSPLPCDCRCHHIPSPVEIVDSSTPSLIGVQSPSTWDFADIEDDEEYPYYPMAPVPLDRPCLCLAEDATTCARLRFDNGKWPPCGCHCHRSTITTPTN